MNEQENKNALGHDDDFIIGKGFELDTENNDTVKKQRKSKNKNNSLVKNIIWIVSIFIVSIGVALGVIFAGADFTGIGFGRGGNAVMDIKMGTSVSEIAEKLQDSGAIKVPLLFRAYAKLKNYDSQFKYGVYTFNTDIGYDAICQMLINEGAKAETVKVTIPEGTGINDYTKNVNGEKVTVPGITTLLERAGVCTRSEFLAALEEIKRDSKLLSCSDDIKTYHTLEGYLFPETYSFYAYYDGKECAKLAAQTMVNEAEKRITDSMFKKAEKLGYSMNEILTMASIIQMEAGKSTTEMPYVASVFYNRLKSKDFKTLGSSPTCYYGGSFKQDDERYDTYKIEGLPPGPLCSPGIAAINAALNPAENAPYYYFVTDKDGKFYFHKTYAEQEATIARLQQGDDWIYEYFD